MSNLFKIFKKEKDIIIGAIHFPPLLGYKDSPGINTALRNALIDLDSLKNAGVDGIIFENNYDTPHKITVGPETVAAMTYLGQKIISKTKLPVGISVLWNDYRAALAISKVIGLKFIRIPAFVDKVKTNYGVAEPVYNKAIKYREKIGADNVYIFSDIHVKHSVILSKLDIQSSAKKAIKEGSDALIITGKWTGDAPDLEDLRKVRQAVMDFPIIIGSGANQKNANLLLKYANGIIISTAIKEGKNKDREINLKNWNQRISGEKASTFVKKVRDGTLKENL